MEEHDLLTVKEVAGAFRVSRVTVIRMIKADQLEGIKVGRDWRIKRASYQAFLARQTDEASA